MSSASPTMYSLPFSTLRTNTGGAVWTGFMLGLASGLGCVCSDIKGPRGSAYNGRERTTLQRTTYRTVTFCSLNAPQCRNSEQRSNDYYGCCSSRRHHISKRITRAYSSPDTINIVFRELLRRPLFHHSLRSARFEFTCHAPLLQRLDSFVAHVQHKPNFFWSNDASKRRGESG